MHTLHQVFAASMVIFSLSAGCAQEPEVQPLATAFYDVPILQDTDLPSEEGCWEGNTSVFCPVLITENGELFHQGAAIEIGEIDAIEKKWWAGEYALIGIEVHANAKFGAAVEHLSVMDDHIDEEQASESSSLLHRVTTYAPDLYPPFALMGLKYTGPDSGRELNPDALAEFEERQFLGKADEYALPLFVGHSKQHDACVFKLQGDAVSAPELYERAFQRLDSIVVNAGGVEALMEETSLIERIEGRLQAESDTPWRCIGAGIYGVGRAGWPEIRLEVMESQAKGPQNSTYQ